MINTVNIKQQRHEVFTVGDTNASEVILIIGSCRSVAYLNYLNRYNESHGRPFKIHFIEPFNYHFDDDDKVVPLEPAINALENNPRIREVLASTTIYLHEHFQYFGMFNSARDAAKNIYQFGLNPRIDVSIPNFHDRFILFNEQMMFNADGLRDRVLGDGGIPKRATLDAMRDYGLAAMEKFQSICKLSDIPEMAEEIGANWRQRRFFWTGNHVSKHFTSFIFQQINARFLHLPLDKTFWGPAREEDMFAEPHTPITQYDMEAYGLQWGETPVQLRL